MIITRFIIRPFKTHEKASRQAGIGSAAPCGVAGRIPLLALRAWMEGEPGSAEARGALGFFDLLGNAMP